MPDRCPIILTDTVPTFTDGGDFLLCELHSGGKTWKFGISWGCTEAALPACAHALEGHRLRSRNVLEFERLQLGH